MKEICTAEDGHKITLRTLEAEREQIRRAIFARVPEKTIEKMQSTLKAMQEMSGEA